MIGIKYNNFKNNYFLNFVICGALIFTFPGIFLAIVSSLTDFKRSFSLAVIVLSLRKTATAVLAAFPRLPVPGVNFTLNLKHCYKKKVKLLQV